MIQQEEGYEAEERAAIEGGEPIADPLAGLEHLGRVAVVGLAQFRALDRMVVAYAWEPSASPGWIVVIGGGVGTGKTTLLFLLVVARASVSGPAAVLGRLVEPAPSGRFVVIVEGEIDDRATAKKLLRSASMLGVDPRALDRVIVVARKGVVLGDPVWEDVEKLVAAGLVSDIVIDTIARVVGGDANDEGEQAKAYDRITATIQLAPSTEARPVCWMAAHTRKSNGVEIEDISGSAQRIAQADSVLMVGATKAPSGKVLYSTVYFKKLRHDPEHHPEPVTLTVDADPATGLPRVRCDLEVEDKRPLEARIESLLGERGEAMTKAAVAAALGRSKEDVAEAVDALFAAKRLRGAKIKGKNGQTYGAIALRDEAGNPSGPGANSGSRW